MKNSEEKYERYEAVIGLEIHAQMLTATKAYSDDANEFGAAPNTLISPISLGHPGTLPMMNTKTIEFAIRMGIACHAHIHEHQYFARKNYFYPDLPKGYQITQDKTPICTGGYLFIQDAEGKEKRIGLTRIHMEEDAGKSIHDVDVHDTLVDLNRAGVPLIEIVSEPEIRSSTEAYNYVAEMRKLVRYLDICDGNMEEGSLRCDANISVRLNGSAEFGTKVEVKNMNSIRNVQRAIDFEIKRQIDAIENGEIIVQETRSFDAVNGITISMRSKEAANDYRYFPEPDLLPLVVNQEHIEKVKASMPALPRELFIRYTEQLGLSSYDASNLIEQKAIALYYDELIKQTKNYKAAANWVMGDIKSYLNQNGLEIEVFPIKPTGIARLISLIDDGKLSFSAASQKVFPEFLKRPDIDPLIIAEELNLIQDTNTGTLLTFIEDVMRQHPKEVQRYQEGEKQLIGFLMGQVMKISGGKADPKESNRLLREKLDL